MSAGKFRWLFVYGTLRPGGGNYPMIKAVIAMKPFEDVTANGRMYHVGGSDPDFPIYPVVDFDEEGTVVGTLLLVERESFQAQQVRRMEEGAGYEEVTVQVRIPNHHRTTLAVSYHYPHERGVGAVIEHGDWAKACAEAPEGEWPELS